MNRQNKQLKKKYQMQKRANTGMANVVFRKQKDERWKTFQRQCRMHQFYNLLGRIPDEATAKAEQLWRSGAILRGSKKSKIKQEFENEEAEKEEEKDTTHGPWVTGLREYLHEKAMKKSKAGIYTGCSYPSDIIEFLEENNLKGMDWMEKRNPLIKVGDVWKRRDDCIEVKQAP